MVITFISLIPLSFLSAIAGRAGGMSKDVNAEPKWIPAWIRQRWVRPLGCSACIFIPVLITHPSWWIVPAIGATYGTLTTYWDEIFSFDNLWFSGFCVGLSAMFLMTIIPWWIILIRAFVLAVAWGVLNIIINKGSYKDGTEELWRYGILGLSTVFILF